ncbi:MAG: AsmA family protein [Candidatus Brocadia sp.]|nr:AsmA family protein [Candidatus Brocadia sp.]
MKKIIIIVLSVIFVLLVGAVVTPFLIDLNKYKGEIIDLAKPHVARDLDFGGIKLTILKGLGAEIQGLRIAENPGFGTGDFLNLERLRVKVKLFPLLRKQIQVKELILDKPVVRLIKNTKGELNITDLMGSETKEQEDKEQKDTESQEEKENKNNGSKNGENEVKNGSTFLAGLLVSKFTLNQGHIDFIDEFTQPGTTTTTTIDLLDMKFTDVSVNKPIRMSTVARLPGSAKQNFMIKGAMGPIGDTLDIKRLFMDIAVSLEEFDLGTCKSYLPPDLPLSPVDGVVSMDISLRGDMASGVTSEGQMQCKELILAEGNDKKALRKMHITLQEEMKFAWEKGSADIDRLDLSMDENTISLTGSVEGFNTKPQWDITLRTQAINPDYVFLFYPSIRESLPKDVSFSGSLGMEMISKGNMDNLQADCNVEMKDLDILYGETFRKPRPVPCQISVKASKTGDDIHLDPCVVKMHTLSLRTSGKITGLTNPRFDLSINTDDTSLKGWESLVPALKEYEPEGNFVLRSSLKGTMNDAAVNLQFSSPRLAFKLSQSSDDGRKAATSQGFFESMDMNVQAVKKDEAIMGSGNLEVRKGEVLAAPFEKMQAQFDYQNDILGIHGFRVHAFQGGVVMDGKVRPRELRWNVKPVITNINMAEAMDTFTQYKGLFKGLFSGSFVANNAGDEKQKGAMNASGSFRLDQGEIMNLNLVDTVLDALFGIKGVSKFLEKEGSELEKQKITRFDYLDGDFSMTGNKIYLKKAALHNIHTAKATDSDAFIDGLVDCNTSSLDLKGKVVLSQEYSAKLAKKNEPLNALLNPEKRMVLPITVTGTFSKPRPILDIPYVTSAMAKYYGRKELEKLGDKIGLPKKGDKGKQGKESPIGNILKDILK